MNEIVKGVYHFSGFPANVINMYLVGDVLIDAGVRRDQRRILKALKGHRVSAHALTHVHPDHQGASHAVCEALNIPLWCPEAEVEAMEKGDLTLTAPINVITRLQDQFWTGPAHTVARGLHEGDEVADFTVIDSPGHSPGHVAFWRESDRTLIVGDVARNIDYFTLREGLAEPPSIFTMDMAQNRQSLQKLAALNPRVVLFGHGKPLLDGARFVAFASGESS